MDREALWIVATLGAGTLIGSFWRMKDGFGPNNLRVLGIVLIASLASLLAIAKADSLTAAMGLLGAIAGYLFGTKTKEKATSSSNIGVTADGAKFGDNARLAGRDINETVHKIERMLGDMQGIAQATIGNLEILAESNRPRLMTTFHDSLRWESDDPNFVGNLKALSRSHVDGWTQLWIERCLVQPECRAAIRSAIAQHTANGWSAREIGFDNHGDGIHVNVSYEREFDLA